MEVDADRGAQTWILIQHSKTSYFAFFYVIMGMKALAMKNMRGQWQWISRHVSVRPPS